MEIADFLALVHRAIAVFFVLLMFVATIASLVLLYRAKQHL